MVRYRMNYVTIGIAGTGLLCSLIAAGAIVTEVDMLMFKGAEHATAQSGTATRNQRYLAGKESKRDIEPGVARNEPGVARNEPGVARNEPGVARNEPGVAGNEPDVARNEPGVAGNEPGVAGNEPEVAGNEPEVAGNEPDVAGNEPEPEVAGSQQVNAGQQVEGAGNEPVGESNGDLPSTPPYGNAQPEAPAERAPDPEPTPEPGYTTYLTKTTDTYPLEPLVLALPDRSNELEWDTYLKGLPLVGPPVNDLLKEPGVTVSGILASITDDRARADIFMMVGFPYDQNIRYPEVAPAESMTLLFKMFKELSPLTGQSVNVDLKHLADCDHKGLHSAALTGVLEYPCVSTLKYTLFVGNYHMWVGTGALNLSFWAHVTGATMCTHNKTSDEETVQTRGGPLNMMKAQKTRNVVLDKWSRATSRVLLPVQAMGLNADKQVYVICGPPLPLRWRYHEMFVWDSTRAAFVATESTLTKWSKPTMNVVVHTTARPAAASPAAASPAAASPAAASPPPLQLQAPPRQPPPPPVEVTEEEYVTAAEEEGVMTLVQFNSRTMWPVSKGWFWTPTAFSLKGFFLPGSDSKTIERKPVRVTPSTIIESKMCEFGALNKLPFYVTLMEESIRVTYMHDGQEGAMTLAAFKGVTPRDEFLTGVANIRQIQILVKGAYIRKQMRGKEKLRYLYSKSATSTWQDLAKIGIRRGVVYAQYNLSTGAHQLCSWQSPEFVDLQCNYPTMVGDEEYMSDTFRAAAAQKRLADEVKDETYKELQMMYPKDDPAPEHVTV